MTGPSGPLVVVGDALLDRDLDGRVDRLAPDAPVPVVDDPVARLRPGGAALAAALAAADGRDVVLVTALADDDAGRELAALVRRCGVQLVDIGLDGPTPEKVRVRADGRSLLRLDYGGRAAVARPAGPEALQAVRNAKGVLVADYGRGVAADRGLRAALRELHPRVPTVWDPHPRGAQPTPGVRLVTPNRAEASRFAPAVAGDGLFGVTAQARALRERWAATGVAVTLGGHGALLVEGDGTPLVVPAPRVATGDPCGAGDRFAAAAAGLLADGALPSEAVSGAVAAASAFVAAGGAAEVTFGTRGIALDLRDDLAAPPTAEEVIARVRSQGGTVVATGGCFDLVHAGHVSVLRAARSLGDCLIVCLNSDDSVRRLKGPDRPLVTEDDRAAVLLALDCVDAVVVFDEDTPEAALDRLRPDIFAKGGDYTTATLPEARLVETWGGQAVVLPYLPGRSTTNLMKEVVRRHAR